jgi:hypothetical protein
MKRYARIAAALALLTFLAPQAFCQKASPVPAGLVLEESSSGKTVPVGVGTLFYVRLKVDPMQGWGVEPMAGSAVTQQGRPRHLPLLGPNGRPLPTFAPSGHMLYTFKAVKLGKQTLTFKLKPRPRQRTPREKTVAITIEVTKDAPPPKTGDEPTKPASSKPVVQNGLSISVQPAKALFAQGEPIVLNVTFKNVSKKTLTLEGSRQMRWHPGRGVEFVVTDAAGKKQVLHEGTDPRIMAPVRIENKTLAAGGTLLVQASITRWSWSIAASPKEAPGGGKARKFLGPNVLSPGTYAITVRCEFGTFWVTKPQANPVSIKIGPAKAATGGAAGAWTKLFADEGWYKRRKGQERSFMGILQAVPGAGGPSTLMRTAHYKLGKWRLYTKAKKHPALDKLVGKGVEIRGKAVEMNLEGRHLQEIWPGSIRPAKVTIHAPVQAKPSPPIRSIIRPLQPPTDDADK